MNKIDVYTLLPHAANKMKYVANMGIWNGKDFTTYYSACIWHFDAYNARMVFTRDIGYHTGGWWKNPDYERCYHFSIGHLAFTPKVRKQMLEYLFGDFRKLLWVEPPYSPEGKELNIHHYRLFCDEAWQPIKPRGEVYSTQFTEKGWKSFSELHATT